MLKYSEKQSKLELLENYFTGRPITEFTKAGGLFIAIIGLFALADKLIKINQIKQYTAQRNSTNADFQDLLSDNKDNLFLLLELLPDAERQAAYAYISENYFEDFTDQAGNLLLALNILETSQLKLQHQPENIDKEFDKHFGKNYKIIEQQLNQNLGL